MQRAGSIRFSRNAASANPGARRGGRWISRAAPRARAGEAVAGKSEWPGQKRVPFLRSAAQNLAVRWTWLLIFGCLAVVLNVGAQTSGLITTNHLSRLIEGAGQVDLYSARAAGWSTAAVGATLEPGDRVRTLAQSRAAVQLSDRSVIRLDELTTLEILPPRNGEKKRFGLPKGALYFFNRERPADIEFDTPLASGAIRGTEFVLQTSQAVHLALIDGWVSLAPATGEISLRSGEEVDLSPGKPPVKTSLVNAAAVLQWALYYPGIVREADLRLAPPEKVRVQGVLENYHAGDLLKALAAWPSDSEAGSPAQRVLHAQLQLAVGRVDAAGELLAGLDLPEATALRELIAVVRGELPGVRDLGGLSVSELMSQSYALQARAALKEARAAVRNAVRLAPQFGFAHARLAELEFAFGNRRAALAELEQAVKLSPRLASARALEGFVLLEQGDSRGALGRFSEARELDAALGLAWLGQGLALLRERDFPGARAALQAAAALEPQRSVFRSYLGKAESALGNAPGAEKEFRLARQLDPGDPTPWLYSALHLWQENRLNEAIRDLEASIDRNDNRAPFRSRELLDSDRSVRSANLAVIYEEAGLAELSRHLAERSVSESYANFSGHLFLANSLQAEQQASPFDLRLEAARQSELLMANLLAPPGAGNLSQVLSQSERLRFFDQQPAGASSLTTFRSRGDWSETAALFGTVDGFSYALDAVYESFNGQRLNNESARRDFILTAKQRITPDDEAYLQLGTFRNWAGDISSLYNPAQATPGLQAQEKQEPDVYAGWHHAWAPGVHTLFLASRLADRFSLFDPESDQIFLMQSGGVPRSIQSPPAGPAFTNDFSSRFTLNSAELQQIVETGRHLVVAGGRWQAGDVSASSSLARDFTGVPGATGGSGDFFRATAYAYYSFRPVDALSLTAGGAYDHLEFPENTDFPPLSVHETARDKLSPKAGLLFTPWDHGLFRASYTRSLGGLFFDDSVRLEPAQVGGFIQAFRSLIPESVAGLLPGASFETASVGFDQSLRSGTSFGVEAEWLASGGSRSVGILTNSLFLPVADSPSTTRQDLDFREGNLSAYAAQLLGDHFSIGARYRVSEARLESRFPEIPPATRGLDELQQDNTALMHHLSLALNFTHASGVFASWESSWRHQDSFGYSPGLATEDFWQHDFIAGFRFPRRRAELRVGVLNIGNADYRLNPLNLHPDLPRARTFVSSLRLNF